MFTGHDLNVVRFISDRLAVMYSEVVEVSRRGAVSAGASLYGSAVFRRGHAGAVYCDPPNPIDPPSGCRFHTRCYNRKAVQSPCAITLNEGTSGGLPHP
jgi:peptide/nickel transport system ATP-binding protein